VPAEWSAKYKGKFDQGWDKLREETLARQKELGVVPQDAELTRGPAEIPAWDETPDDMKPIFARQMEVYAGFMEHTDHHVGRRDRCARGARAPRRHARLRDQSATTAPPPRERRTAASTSSSSSTARPGSRRSSS
jgi:hypothetical protein